MNDKTKSHNALAEYGEAMREFEQYRQQMNRAAVVYEATRANMQMAQTKVNTTFEALKAALRQEYNA